MRELDWELYRQVCAVLWEHWDPIGVNGFGGPSDEYDRYAPALIRHIRGGADDYKVTELLATFARTSMGLSRVDEPRDRAVARRLIELVRGQGGGAG